MALDYGTTRIGVALSDPLHITAQPYAVIDTAAADFDDRIKSIVVESDVERIVVGLPVHLSGREGLSAEGARKLARRVGEICGVPVELADERFSTKTAEEALLEANTRRDKRRQVIDKVAAAVILQNWLNAR